MVGANGSMAKETIKQLLKAGGKNITMAVRSMEKGLVAMAEIEEGLGKDKTDKLSVVDGFDMLNSDKIQAAVNKRIEELEDQSWEAHDETHSRQLNTALQEVAENAADGAHFIYVHGHEGL